MNCDCGKPARVTSRGKSQCWDCFDGVGLRATKHCGSSACRGPSFGSTCACKCASCVSVRVPDAIENDPHWDGTWPSDGFNYQKAIDTHDAVRADDDFVGGVC
jgi:hypothetical protein